MSNAEPPTPATQPDAFLMSVAPVLELNQEAVANMDEAATDNVYNLVDGLVDYIRPEDGNHADQQFFNLVKTVIHAHRDKADLAEALSSEAYRVEVKDLPAVVEFIAAWLCESLVDVVAAVKEQVQILSGLNRSQEHSEPKPATQQSAGGQAKKAAKNTPAEKPSPVSDDLYPYPFEYRRGATGKAKLLRADEEVALAKIIEAGVLAEDRLQKIGPASDGMSAEEIQLRQNLQTIVSNGKKATDFFVEANIRLVAETAGHYLGFGLSFGDLVQAGTLGLMHAVEMFDYKQGYKFSTYSLHWIRQSLSRATMRQGRTIALPIHIHLDIAKLRDTEEKIKTDLGRPPTKEELSAESGFSLEKILLLQEAAKKVVSLDLPVGMSEGRELTLKDVVEDHNVTDMATDLVDAMQNKALRRVIKDALTPRERLVLEAYVEQPSLQEIAAFLKLPVNTAHATAKRALAKLAHPSVDLPSSIDLTGIGSWRQEAHCRDGGDVDFFPLPVGIYFEEAKFICGLCPVARQCLQYAQLRNVEYGMWGGVSEEERQAMRQYSARIRYVRQKEDEQLNAS